MSYYIKFNASEQESLYDNYYSELCDELRTVNGFEEEALLIADACLKVLKEHWNIHWVLFTMFNLMPQKYCICRNYEATAIALEEVAKGKVDYFEFKRVCGLI